MREGAARRRRGKEFGEEVAGRRRLGDMELKWRWAEKAGMGLKER